MQKLLNYEVKSDNRNAQIIINKRETGDFTYLDLSLKLENEIPGKLIVKFLLLQQIHLVSGVALTEYIY